MSALPAAVTPPADVASREWLRSLRASGVTRDEAVERLHALLLRAARFEACGAQEQGVQTFDRLIPSHSAGSKRAEPLARSDVGRGRNSCGQCRHGPLAIAATSCRDR